MFKYKNLLQQGKYLMEVKMRTIFVALIPLIVLVFADTVFSQTNNNDIEQLNAKILELQQQDIKIQKKHDADINSLK